MKKIIITIAFILAFIAVFMLKEKEKIPFNQDVFFSKIKKNRNSSNKYTYINVWNTKCKPCIEEMPILDSIAQLYKSYIDFVFISDDTDNKVNTLLTKKNIVLKNSIMLNNELSTINYLCEQKKTIRSYPLHFIVNENFKIIHFHSGAILGSMFDPILMYELKKIVNKH